MVYGKKDIRILARFLKEIFVDGLDDPAIGYHKVWSDGYKGGHFVQTASLADPEELGKMLLGDKDLYRNGYVSLGTYSGKQHAAKDKLVNMCALAVDADFTLFRGQGSVTAEEALRALDLAIEEGFVPPTYVEYGRNMRLVYVLKKPYVLASLKGKKRAAVLNFLKRIPKCLADMLNSYDSIIYFNATGQEVNSSLRIPGSLNVRAYGHTGIKPDGSYGFVTDEILCWDVNAEFRAWKWDIDKLAEAVLPDLPKWYRHWDEKGKKKDRNYGGTTSDGVDVYFEPHSAGFYAKREKDLKALQERGYGVGYRHMLCFFFYLNSRQSGKTHDEAWTGLETFNMGFGCPLNYPELLDCIPVGYTDRHGAHEGWERKFRDSTIRDKLFLLDAEPDLFRGKGNRKKSDAAYYDRKYRKAHGGRSKKEQMDFAAACCRKLRELGKTWKEIAAFLGVCERTARNYGKRIEGLSEELLRSAAGYVTTMLKLKENKEKTEKKKKEGKRKAGEAAEEKAVRKAPEGKAPPGGNGTEKKGRAGRKKSISIPYYQELRA